MATPPPEPLSPEAEEEARELLYEVYNELQALAAELGGAAAPAPAVVVVGHQTDGKSALVEALMGFQFNHVGGGTKTRRPVALHLRFNPRCDEPQCRLLAGSGDGADGDDGAGLAGRPMSLADIQVCPPSSAPRSCVCGNANAVCSSLLLVLTCIGTRRLCLCNCGCHVPSGKHVMHLFICAIFISND